MENQKSKKQFILSTVLLLSLVLITVGISYAFFTYIGQGNTENTITTGNLTFVYDDKNAQGNGIKLSNALPVSDDTGKQQTGNNNVFDFQVIATTQGAPIYYEVIGEKGENSTLSENVVKTYLTTVNGSEETPVEKTLVSGKVATFDQLYLSQIPEYEGDKTLYQGTVSEGQTKYTQQFRLRMWLSEIATGVTDGEWDYNNKTFTIKIHVYASNEMLPEPEKPCINPIYTDNSGANPPELVDGMIPVVYNECKKIWEKADTNHWYDYDQQVWANAVTVTEESRDTYMSAATGTEISMDDINTMWVWIPRYEYQYTNLGTQYAGGTQEQPGEIKVNFLSGVTTQASDGANYKVHSAFTFGEEELTGIWYAKFETTGTLATPCTDTSCDVSQVTIKPGLASLRSQSVSSFFYAARSMQLNNASTFGFTSGSGDVHMSKNIEWGAVAYLSQSKYGKYGNPNYEGVNKEVAINNCSKFITGIGGDTVSAGPSSTTCTTNTYETAKGQAASTTGNITGVYDMSGGAFEYVMGNYNNTISFSGFSEMPESKYYDLYTTISVSTACNGGVCYGHALSETSGWYADYASFVFNDRPWMFRSGNFINNTDAGVFFFNGDVGTSSSSKSSHLTLAP